MKKSQNAPVAGKTYETEDYQKNDVVSKGLAETHEQSSDTYTEGTIDGVMENVAGEDIPLQNDGHKK
ncbi:YozQ family protein [Niallia sp. FSL R7-0271]|uniref:YozQ family protein n=1 Tax=Niallia sp. FSL R7-0271 TaxID=2921678 RepID=UPI0030F70304